MPAAEQHVDPAHPGASVDLGATRPDSPILAGPGPYPVGVRLVHLTDPGRLDPMAAGADGGAPRRDRHLVAEVWYPAAPGTPAGTLYRTLLRDGETPVTLRGRACRDAPPAGRHPLVILSHGYPGNRFLMGHLAEALASRGYAVLAADHPDSTYDDQGPFGATLYHRPLDLGFLLAAMATRPDLAAIADAGRTAVVGYSMGGYGALVFAGAGLSARALQLEAAPPGGLLAIHRAGSADHAALCDPRLRAVIAIGPWGRQHDVWDAAGLAGLRVPLLVMAGGADTISGAAAMRRIWAEARGVDRHLLTFEAAGHNAAAPFPAPAESHVHNARLGWAPFLHYADPVWDTLRMNAIAQHFACAFLDLHLAGRQDRVPLLDIPVRGDGTGGGTEDWPGFPAGPVPGLRFETLRAGKSG